jgi:hypothetical protein
MSMPDSRARSSKRLFSTFGLIERRLQLADPLLSLIGRPYVRVAPGRKNTPARPQRIGGVMRAASHHGPANNFLARSNKTRTGQSY